MRGSKGRRVGNMTGLPMLRLPRDMSPAVAVRGAYRREDGLRGFDSRGDRTARQARRQDARRSSKIIAVACVASEAWMARIQHDLQMKKQDDGAVASQ